MMPNIPVQRAVGQLRCPPSADLASQALKAMPEDFKRARNRKLSTKLARSKQLGIDSPRVIEVQV